MKIKDIFICIFFTLLISSLMLFIETKEEKNIKPNEVYSVYINGKSIGLIENEEDFLALVDKKQAEIKNKYEVENVYPPNGMQIQKVSTYNEDIKTSEEIYKEIKDKDPFTIDGYTITIKYKDENKKPLKIYTLKKEYFEEAFYNAVGAFVGSEDLEKYKNNREEDISDQGTKITSIYWDEEITIKEGRISTDKTIFKNSEDLSKFLLFGTTEKQRSYIVNEGDSIEEIIENNNLSIEEFLVANPNIVSKNVLLTKNQEVSIGLISPVVTIVHEVEVVENIVNKFNTEYQDDNSMYAGNTKTLQEGSNGLSKVTESIQYKNGDIENLVITKNEEIQPTINKIVARGTKTYDNSKYTYINSGNEEWRWPTLSPYVITSRFAWRWGKHHNGIDISGCGFGSPIYSSTDGVVTDVNSSCANQGYYGNSCGQQWGNYVRVQYGDFTVIYAHVRNDIKVSVGQTVTRGQQIGTMGNSGSSTGTHLHFAIMKGSGYINPCDALGC